MNGAEAPFDALVLAELGDEFELGPTVARDADARTLLARPRSGTEGLIALHLFARGPFPAVAEDRDLERSHERWAGLCHGHLAPLMRRGATPGLRWCVVPATAGVSLASHLAAEGAMSIPVTIGIAAQVGAALQAAHDIGLSHGRLAASHVMLDVAGGAVLTGFGFARGEAGVPVAERGPAADQAALAFLIYQCVTGDVSTLSDESTMDYWRVPVAIRPVLQQARSVRRSSRYRDMPAFIAALRSAHDALWPRAAAVDRREGTVPGAASLLLVEPPRPAPRRVPALVLLALALAIIGALPATPAPSSRPPSPRPAIVEPVASQAAPLRTPTRSPPRWPSAVVPRIPRRAAAQLTAEVATLPPIRPIPAERAPVAVRDPTLTISSRPWGVVSVDGQYLGNTPVLGAPLTAGPHRVRIERAGFTPHEVLLVARRGEDLRLVDIALKPLPR